MARDECNFHSSFWAIFCPFTPNAANCIEITFRHGCSPVNLLAIFIFRTTFSRNTSLWLLLHVSHADIVSTVSIIGMYQLDTLIDPFNVNLLLTNCWNVVILIWVNMFSWNFKNYFLDLKNYLSLKRKYYF